MDPQLRAQLAQTIYVATPSSIGDWGERSYGTPAAMDARVELADRIIRRGTEEYRSTHTIFVEDAIEVSALVWLPGDDQTDNGIARQVLASHPIPGETGAIHHYEVMV